MGAAPDQYVPVYVTDPFRAVVYRILTPDVHAPATGTHRSLAVAYHPR
jgi:hypothetical protein